MKRTLLPSPAFLRAARRVVKETERVVLVDEGRGVADLLELQRKGILGPLVTPEGSLSPLAERPGALARFLESRD